MNRNAEVGTRTNRPIAVPFPARYFRNNDDLVDINAIMPTSLDGLIAAKRIFTLFRARTLEIIEHEHRRTAARGWRVGIDRPPVNRFQRQPSAIPLAVIHILLTQAKRKYK